MAQRLHPPRPAGEGGHVVGTGDSGPAVRVVLVRPEHPGNVGAVARVVRNTGMEGLSLVDPGDWRTIECWRTAWGAHEVLEEARVFDHLGPAIADATYAAAFSGRADGPPLDVREAAAEIAALGAAGRACLVFGPESAGLTLDEMALCGRRARIPSHPLQPSLNLSHAVMVAGYEVLRAVCPRGPGGGTPPARASQDEKDAAVALLLDALVAVGAGPSTEDALAREWRTLFTRMDLSPREARLVEHLARRVQGAARTRGGGERP